MLELYFGSIARPARLVGCPELAGDTKSVVVGWDVTSRPVTAADCHPDPMVVIEHAADGYAVVSSEKGLVGQSHVEAISAVMWHLVRELYLQRSDTIPLHCGSFCLNGHLIGVSGPSGMGKSTFTARLCAEPDCLVFGDDILLARTDGTASGVGVLPRLRPPLPLTASDAFRSFVERSDAPKDAQYQYISCANAAPVGSEGRMSAFVILSRRPEIAAPYFVGLTPQQMFMEWIGASVARNASDFGAHLDRLEALARLVPCYRLVYSDLEAAVELLRKSSVPKGAFSPPLLAAPETAAFGGADRWACDPDLRSKTAFGSTFLYRAQGGEVVQINETASVLLEMAADGCTFTDMIEIFSEVYPDIARGTLEQDISSTVRWLLEKRFLIPSVLAPRAA